MAPCRAPDVLQRCTLEIFILLNLLGSEVNAASNTF